MNKEVNSAPLFLQQGEDGIHTGFVGYITMSGDDTADFFRQGFNTLLQGITLVGQRNLRARGADRLCNSVCNRSAVRHAHDETALAAHDSAFGVHNSYHFPDHAEKPATRPVMACAMPRFKISAGAGPACQKIFVIARLGAGTTIPKAAMLHA